MLQFIHTSAKTVRSLVEIRQCSTQPASNCRTFGDSPDSLSNLDNLDVQLFSLATTAMESRQSCAVLQWDCVIKQVPEPCYASCQANLSATTLAAPLLCKLTSRTHLESDIVFIRVLSASGRLNA